MKFDKGAYLEIHEEHKHTDDANASRSEMNETQSQESLRNLHKETEDTSNFKSNKVLKIKKNSGENPYQRLDEVD